MPFTREDQVLYQKPFLDYEVQYNLFHRIIESQEYLALKTEDNNVIALQNPGHMMWLWVNESLEKTRILEMIEALCRELTDYRLPGIAGEPEIARSFAEKYAMITGVDHERAMSLEAYHCLKVKKPQGIIGRLVPAEIVHTDVISEYLTGFIYWSYGKTVTQESQVSFAERLISSGNLFLWEVDRTIVSMACIAHRSARHARINSVYTPPEQRKKGYASALVAELSASVLIEGLTPVLYADVDNPTSNKVYRNIGYIECGKIDEIRFQG